MSIFGLYLKLGYEHIADVQGYDHILFIAALCGVYMIRQWKSVLILVTAFTLGHTITLALATLQIVNIRTDIIEFLIPVTIFITSLINMIYKKTEYTRRLHIIKYIIAMFFGLIHGLGFSTYLKSLLGFEESIVTPLLAFNIGLELGQIFIVFGILLIGFVFIKLLKVKRREWNLVLSGASAGIALILMLERI